jgi:hypothetical protein
MEHPMNSLSASVDIPAPLAEVWEQVSHVGYVSKWHPKVENAPVLSASDVGVGATRRCEFYDGTSVVEKVVEVVEHSHVRLELSEFSMPFSRAEAVVRVEALSEGLTRVSLTMAYDLKYGPIGWLMNVAMIRPMMTGMLGTIVGGLSHHVQTGELIGEDWEKTQAAA